MDLLVCQSSPGVNPIPRDPTIISLGHLLGTINELTELTNGSGAIPLADDDGGDPCDRYAFLP